KPLLRHLAPLPRPRNRPHRRQGHQPPRRRGDEGVQGGVSRMKAPISKPVNDAQRAFNALCENGGGARGGPARSKVLDLLWEAGKGLNRRATREMREQFAAFPDANPWHVCFAVALSWGHLAELDLDFTQA